ncbi:MAG: class II D-tagatose-bisphosphate aldolase, non-catalytic subunit [Clostridia bacterium]|nr:class II D-tagatose-bisphosphate aldolase, non-catalytic subunit [Clostridia bacterium]
MNAITITEMFARAKKIKANGDKFSLLGIGPMSKTLIEAVLALGAEKDFPIMLIASRNQIDSDIYGGGYVCNFDQKRFKACVDEMAAKVGFDGLCYLCRDHGGPWQRDEERSGKLPVEEAMRIAKESYVADMEAGFDLLHIDPTKDPHVEGVVSLDVVLDRTVELIEYLEGVRKEKNLPEIGYEVGTEETSGGLTSIEAFEDFAKKLTDALSEKGLPLPLFIVGQTGTLTRLTQNVGQYNTAEAIALTKSANKFGMGLKEHNGDYLSNAILLEHPAMQLDAMNVAPEFGVVETMAYLELIELERKFIAEEKRSDALAAIEKYAVASGRWRKWMVGELRNATAEQLDRENIDLIVRMCGHYTYEIEDVKKELAVLFANIDSIGLNAHEYVIKRIKDSIDRYIFCFNNYGLTSRIMNA